MTAGFASIAGGVMADSWMGQPELKPLVCLHCHLAEPMLKYAYTIIPPAI